MKRRKFTKLLGVAVAGAGVALSATNANAPAPAAAAATTTSKPSVPAGWVAYGLDPQEWAALPGAMDLIAVGYYNRATWAELNPVEDVYNWQPVDDYLNRWAAAGKTAAFGFFPLDTWRPDPIVPDWVFKAGARYWTYQGDGQKSLAGPHKIPVWNDPVWKAKLKKWVNALGARFNGDPRIAWIDARFYGNYGENHFSPFWRGDSDFITAAEWEEQARWWLAAFPDTHVVVPWAALYLDRFPALTASGMGVRCDGAMGPNQPLSYFACAGYAHGIAPSVMEWFEGWNGPYWNLNTFLLQVEAARPTHIGFCWPSEYLWLRANHPELLSQVKAYLENSANMPSQVSKQVNFTVTFTDTNKQPKTGLTPAVEVYRTGTTGALATGQGIELGGGAYYFTLAANLNTVPGTTLVAHFSTTDPTVPEKHKYSFKPGG